MKIIAPLLMVFAFAAAVRGDDTLPGDTLPGDESDAIESLLEGLGDQPAEQQPAEATPPAVIDGEDIGTPAEPSDPLASIGGQMQQVKLRIDSGDTADETQFLQKQIVSDLDKLLEKLNKQCQGGQCNNPSQNPSSKSGAGKPKGGSQPGQASNRPNAQGSEEGTRKAEGVEESAADPKAMVREAWGHLPERLREQVQAAAFERFLPQYEAVIEAYYQRLAEDNHGP